MTALFDVPATVPERADLPPLRGSPKQLRWAAAIRREKLAECERVIVEWRRLAEVRELRGDPPEMTEEARGRMRAAVDRLAQLEKTTAAGWWIDNRERSARELLDIAPPVKGG